MSVYGLVNHFWKIGQHPSPKQIVHLYNTEWQKFFHFCSKNVLVFRLCFIIDISNLIVLPGALYPKSEPFKHLLTTF